jgi:hypothetical protein
MKKRYFLLILILFISIFSYTGIVKATDDTVSDRDMAIASALSYVPLQKNKTMAQSFSVANINVVSKIVNFVNSKFNLHDYATIHELDDWKVDDYNGLKALTENGLSVFRLKRNNDIIIVITGSNSPTDAFEDIKYGLCNYNNQEKYLKQYIMSTLKEYSSKDGNYNFYITGHSLGGYLAQIGGATMEDAITQNANTYKNITLKRIVDFNGMGIDYFTLFGSKYNYGSQEKVIETLKKIGNDGRLIEYYTYGDVVSALGVHYGELRMLTPSIDSITYHRTNYQALKSFGNNLIRLAEKETVFNGFKTDLTGVQKFYQVNNIAAYLNLTHEADTFVTIDLNESKNKPVVKIIQNRNVLSSHISKGTSFIQSSSSVTLKALTSYASAKKYEWYVSDDKENWKLIKTIDLSNLNGVAPTNTLDIDINSIPSGKSKYYKVMSYYDDNYVARKYHYNEKTKKYEYIEEKDKSKTTEYEPLTAIVQVKHRKPTTLSTLFARLRIFKK